MPLAGFTTHTSAHGHTNPSLRNQAVRAEILIHMVRQAYRNEVIQVKCGHPRPCRLHPAAAIQSVRQLFVRSGYRKSARCHNGTLPFPVAFDSGHYRGCDLSEGRCYRKLGIPVGSLGLSSPVLNFRGRHEPTIPSSGICWRRQYAPATCRRVVDELAEPLTKLS